MKTLETIAAIVTAVLAFVGLWTVVMAVRVEIAHRRRKNRNKEGRP
jgi:cell division protein FtsX